MSGKFLKLISEVELMTAKVATSSASFFGFYQPKEPVTTQTNQNIQIELEE